MQMLKRSTFVTAVLLAAWPLARPAGAQAPAAGSVVEVASQAILASPRVIKALEDRLVTSPLVSGASILGDGTVVLILNVLAVISYLSRIQPVGAIA